jgi:sarcosine oxidase
MTWDVGIIGLGTMGSMAAWQLAQRGTSVVGFEQFGIGHDRSAVGGETRLFRTAYKEGAEYVPLLKESKHLWKQLEVQSGNKLLHLNGGLNIGPIEDEFMQNVIKSVNDFDIDHEILDYVDAKRRYPQHILGPDEIMVLDKEAGFLRPELAVVSAVKRAEQLGAEIRSHAKVESFEAKADGVVIKSDGREYKVKQLLITAGPWVGEMLPQFKPVVNVKKIILSWFPAKNVEDYQPSRFPIFTRRSCGHRLFGAPTVEGSMVKVGVSNPGDIVKDVNHLNRTVELSEFKESMEVVSKFFKGLYTDPVRVSAYMDAYTDDGHSMVGRLPGYPNVVVMGGFSGHGFKMAPALGKIASDILIHDRTPFDLKSLSPDRFLPQLKTEF